MKHLFFSLMLSISSAPLWGQAVEGVKYVLPKTALHFRVTVEKTTYTPGDFAIYTRQYLRKNVGQEKQTTYRLLSIQMEPKAVADTAKQFTLLADKKHSITRITRTDDGRLLALNNEEGEVKTTFDEQPCGTLTVSAPHPAPLNPRDYMTEDILQAGSTAKMAELSAQEIYDIRDSRNQLSRGEADNMPKDGTQLQLMMGHLNTQEQALTQLFEGLTVKDTLATTFDFLPTREGRSVLFRFSKWLGVVDADDLGGAPYYIDVTDLHSVNTAQPASAEDKKKEDKNDIGLRVNLPGKAAITVQHDGREVESYELALPQFGTTETLSGELFGKKLSSKILLSPITGAIVKMEQIAVKE